MSMIDQLVEFHEAFGHPVNIEPTYKDLELRFSLHDEENAEVAEALANVAQSLEKVEEWNDPKIKATLKENLTKEICDNIYVLIGTAVAFGLPLKEAFDEVHRSNMSKLGDDGKPLYREDGKVLKGPNYTPPNLEQFF